jgi:hypothetical protein
MVSTGGLKMLMLNACVMLGQNHLRQRTGTKYHKSNLIAGGG